MDLTYLDISFTGILEIGKALEDFKSQGKKVIAYSDFYDKKNSKSEIFENSFRFQCISFT